MTFGNQFKEHFQNPCRIRASVDEIAERNNDVILFWIDFQNQSFQGVRAPVNISDGYDSRHSKPEITSGVYRKVVSQCSKIDDPWSGCEQIL